MQRLVAVGVNDFEEIRKNNYFYIDKTNFIKEWWEGAAFITLINRPCNFGKTLNMDMLDKFFSIEYADRGDLFEGLNIWREEKYRQLQGTYPVIKLDFSKVKGQTLSEIEDVIYCITKELCEKWSFLKDKCVLSDYVVERWNTFMSQKSDLYDVEWVIEELCYWLYKYYGKKVIILIDGYDILNCAELSLKDKEVMMYRISSMFLTILKTNKYLERGIITGVSCINGSYLYNGQNMSLNFVSDKAKYSTAFGFTDEEVIAALDEYHMLEKRDEAKQWYGGYCIGRNKNIYNPRSMTSLLSEGEFSVYRTDINIDNFVSKLLRKKWDEVKNEVILLLNGGVLQAGINFEETWLYEGVSNDIIINLLFTFGYISTNSHDVELARGNLLYELRITNYETKLLLGDVIR